MSQKLLYHPQVSSTIKEMRGKGVAQHMGMNLFVYRSGVFSQDFLYSSRRKPPAIAINEQGIVLFVFAWAPPNRFGEGRRRLVPLAECLVALAQKEISSVQFILVGQLRDVPQDPLQGLRIAFGLFVGVS